MDKFLGGAGIGLIIVTVVVIYFLPALIAYKKIHPNERWIWICNLFFGATGIGWLICLILALSYNNEKVKQ